MCMEKEIVGIIADVEDKEIKKGLERGKKGSRWEIKIMGR